MASKTPKQKPASVRITESSGNVFADLGVPNPEQELMKAELTLQLYRIVKQRGMTQAETAKVLGISPPSRPPTTAAREAPPAPGRRRRGAAGNRRPASRTADR